MTIKENFALKDIKEIGAEILKKVQEYSDFITHTGKKDLWRRVRDSYYKGISSLGRINNAGEHGEYTCLSVNHYKNLLTHLHVMTTAQRPALDPRATNTDTESTAQCKLASGLLDFYLREKEVERHLKQVVQYSLMYAEGFLKIDWDVQSGEEYGVNPDTQTVVKEGDLKFTTYPPHFVARDIYRLDNEQDNEWYITVDFVNKFELASKYPELADKITDLYINSKDLLKLNLTSSSSKFNESTQIPLFTFLHKRTSALPDGRMTTVLSDEIVLFDGPLPYKKINLFRMAPENEDFTIFGNTIGYDLLAIQEAINSLYSTVATNQSSFGVQSILVPRGFNISVQSLTGGLNLIEYDPALGKPEALQLTMTAPEIFNFIKQLETVMEVLSGVTSVARGQPEASLKSGSALALVQSQAIQFNSGLTASYNSLLEQTGTAMINILKDFATVPRVAQIAGKANRSYMKQFSGADLNMINRVVVESGNALSKTLSGKVQLAENMMQAGWIKNSDEYVAVLTTGKLDHTLDGDMLELYNIKMENESLSEGQPQIAIISDKHMTHINEHKSVLSSPDSRKDPNIVQMALDHMQQHINLMKTGDPVFLQALGQPSFAPPPMPGMPPMGPGAAGSPMPTPSPEGQENAPIVSAENPVTQEAGAVNMPSMPNNALTGKTFDNSTGGL